MLPPQLAKELGELHEGLVAEVIEEADFINVMFADFLTGPAFSNPTTTLLLRVPRSYPDAGLDMFWTDVTLVLSDGGMPRNAEHIETHAGRQWRRFSWHHNGWNPGLNNLQTYVEFVRRRFCER